MSRRSRGAGLCATMLMLVLCVPLAGAGESAASTAYSPVDPETLAGPEYYDAGRFPDLGRSVFHPDAALPAPVRAVLMVDAREGDLQRARYRVRHHLAPGARADAAAVAEVEVIRLNLGPSVRDELIAQDPSLPVGPPEAFGTGPHVAYRFRMGPVQGMEAAITHVERRELGNAEARGLMCLDDPCLEPAPGLGRDGKWQSIPAALRELPFESGRADGPAAAAVLAFLLDALGEDAQMPIPVTGTPRFEFVISRNSFGQDRASLGLGRDSVVLDDEIGTLWVRWTGAGGATPEASILTVRR